jgi:hypothetical protein
MQEVFIKKPLYGRFVYIRDTILNEAIRRREKLLVKIPDCSAIVDPYTWKIEAIKNSKVMKKVFNYSEYPMILFGGYVKGYESKGRVENKTTKKKMPIQLKIILEKGA